MPGRLCSSSLWSAGRQIMYFTLLHWQHPLFTRRQALRLLIQMQYAVHMTRRERRERRIRKNASG